MERLVFKVTYADGREVEAVAKPKDLVAFERQYGIPFHEFSHIEHVYYLAWSPLHRQQREPRAFDEFLDLIDDVEEIAPDKAQEDTGGPFPTAPSDEPSPA